MGRKWIKLSALTNHVLIHSWIKFQVDDCFYIQNMPEKYTKFSKNSGNMIKVHDRINNIVDGWCPKPFVQIFMILVWNNNIYVPLIFFSRPNKKLNSYQQCFRKLSQLIAVVTRNNSTFHPKFLIRFRTVVIHTSLKRAWQLSRNSTISYDNWISKWLLQCDKYHM